MRSNDSTLLQSVMSITLHFRYERTLRLISSRLGHGRESRSAVQQDRRSRDLAASPQVLVQSATKR